MDLGRPLPISKSQITVLPNEDHCVKRGAGCRGACVPLPIRQREKSQETQQMGLGCRGAMKGPIGIILQDL